MSKRIFRNVKFDGFFRGISVAIAYFLGIKETPYSFRIGRNGGDLLVRLLMARASGGRDLQGLGQGLCRKRHRRQIALPFGKDHLLGAGQSQSIGY